MFQQNLDSLSPQVLQYPGNETKFRSDKNKHRRPNSPPLICRVHPLILVARLIFRAGKFRPRPETIFHLQWTKYICIASPRRGFACGVHLTKCNPRYWRQKMPSGGHLYSWEGANPPIHQPSSQSFISISYLSSFRIQAKSHEKNYSWLPPSLCSKEPSLATPSKDDNSCNDDVHHHQHYRKEREDETKWDLPNTTL